jgi:hypothetical protein
VASAAILASLQDQIMPSLVSKQDLLGSLGLVVQVHDHAELEKLGRGLPGQTLVGQVADSLESEL